MPLQVSVPFVLVLLLLFLTFFHASLQGVSTILLQCHQTLFYHTWRPSVVLCGQVCLLKIRSQRCFSKAFQPQGCFLSCAFKAHFGCTMLNTAVLEVWLERTWICRGRLALMVYSSSLVGFSLHISTSSRSMSPLISRPLATRLTRVTPHSTGVLSDLRAEGWQPVSESLTAIQRWQHTNTALSSALTVVKIGWRFNVEFE